MAKFHVNPATGEPGICRARRNCPFGGAEEHYDSKEAARAAYERKMEDGGEDQEPQGGAGMRQPNSPRRPSGGAAGAVAEIDEEEELMLVGSVQ